jgi:pimeloyl-ACP methyl ester carboxylesterase
MQSAVAKIQHSKILTVHGTADSVIPVEDGKGYAELIPNSDLVIVEGADHNFRGKPEHAEQLIQVVVDYMVKHARH